MIAAPVIRPEARERLQKLERRMANLSQFRGAEGIATDTDAQARLWQQLNTEFQTLMQRERQLPNL